METIGDAYMVVGGLPEPNTTHAADVCNQALDMLMCSKMVKDPTDMSKNVEVRKSEVHVLYGDLHKAYSQACVNIMLMSFNVIIL